MTNWCSNRLRRELDAVRQLVKKEMEGVCELAVPLLVEVGTGVNWRDAK